MLNEIELYEVDISYSGETDGVACRYARTKTEAVRIAGNPEALIPDGCTVQRCTVYRCTLSKYSASAMMFALLNGEVEPRRVAVVLGDLPLPLAFAPPVDGAEPSDSSVEQVAG